VNKVRFALIGAGFMGKFHGRTLASTVGAHLSVVVDVDETAAREVASWSDGCQVTSDVTTALAMDVDAVVIVTPAQTHAAVIERAARAGKAVFCEKPIATTLEDAARIREVLEETGVPFQIGFQRRFDPGVARLRTLFEEGELGRIEVVRSVTCDPYGPDYEGMQRAAGIFHDTLSHDMDMALAFGGPIAEVMTRGAAHLDPRFAELGKPDTTVISIQFESGALGVIENRLQSTFGYETVLEVSGSKGKGVVRDDQLDDLTLHRADRSERAFVPWFLERYAHAYREEIAAFVTALQAGERPELGAEQGVDVLRACLAAERSYREGGAVALRDVT